ncbi:hypothetical protein [Enterococcus phage vB_EfaS_Ef7.1]|nr:hypothetical protein [Enterococcus phage vB_EfaS_Ef7.1]
MNIASIDRGAYTPVEVSVRDKTVMIENTNNLITFNKSGVEQLIQALQQALKEIPEEPKYVVLLPFKKAALTDWKYFYINTSGGIDFTDTAADVWGDGCLTSEQLESLDENIRTFAISAEEFKQNEIGEF